MTSEYRLSQTVECPIPVAVPLGKYFKGGIPLYSLGNTRHVNRERWGEMLTGYDKCGAHHIRLGQEFTFLGVTIEDTMGQSILSVQGAGVANISATAVRDAELNNIKVGHILCGSPAHDLKLKPCNGNPIGPVVGKVAEIYYSLNKKVISLDVKLNVYDSRKYVSGTTRSNALAAGAPDVADGDINTGFGTDDDDYSDDDDSAGGTDEAEESDDDDDDSDSTESNVDSSHLSTGEDEDANSAHEGMPAVEAFSNEEAENEFAAGFVDGAEDAGKGFDRKRLRRKTRAEITTYADRNA